MKIEEGNFGIYGCWKIDMLMYVGSSVLPLHELEYNHRHWKEKNLKSTDFRSTLSVIGQDWKFGWIQEPFHRNRRDAEIEEGKVIRSLQPVFNTDTDPYETSVSYRRYPRLPE